MKTWSSWEIIRHQVAICGLVLDKSGERISGVRVDIISRSKVFRTRVSVAASAAEKKWDDLDERLDRTVTRVDGIFYFLDLPAGHYTLSFDTRSGAKDEKNEAVIWDILPAVREATIGRDIMTPYKLIPHVSFKIPGGNSVEYEVKGR